MGSGKAITAFVHIKDGSVIYNNTPVFEYAADVNADALNAVYNAQQINYPKFFRMDGLCKTAFLAVEILLKNVVLKDKYKQEEIGILLSTANGSLDADMKYYEASQHAPSPALFVYTLPNVAIGELCIRHGIKGETACFVFDIFDAQFQTWYADTLFDSCGIKACISGWADFYDGKFEAFFYLVETDDNKLITQHNSENIDKIYSHVWKN